jgi:hypothetical protein
LEKPSHNDETETTESEILTEMSAQTENNTSQNSSGTDLAPRTADDTDLNQWMELLFLSGIGVLSLAVTRRKKNHRAM